MPPEWENPEYELHRRRRRIRRIEAGLVVFLIAAMAVLLLVFKPKIPNRKEFFPKSEPPKEARPVLKPDPETPGSAPVEAELSDIGAAEIMNMIEEEMPGEDLLEKARAAVLAGDPDRAISIFKKLVEIDPRHAVELGMLCFQRNRYGEAIQYLEMALDDTNQRFLVRKTLALACYQVNQLQKCARYIREALAIHMDPELAVLNRRLSKETALSERYVEEQVSTFRLLFDGYEHEEIRRTVLGILKDAYGSIGRRMNYFPTHPISVILYSERDFFDVTRSPSWAGGLYDGKIRIPVRGAEKSPAELRRVLRHEYVHALIHSLTTVCPHWIHEGMAEYFSESRIPSVGQVIPLSLLERGFPSGPSSVVLAAYQESHQAVAELIQRYGLFRMMELFKQLSQGKSLEDAFQQSFFLSYQRFLQDWGK